MGFVQSLKMSLSEADAPFSEIEFISGDVHVYLGPPRSGKTKLLQTFFSACQPISQILSEGVIKKKSNAIIPQPTWAVNKVSGMVPVLYAFQSREYYSPFLVDFLGLFPEISKDFQRICVECGANLCAPHSIEKAQSSVRAMLVTRFAPDHFVGNKTSSRVKNLIERYGGRWIIQGKLRKFESENFKLPPKTPAYLVLQSFSQLSDVSLEACNEARREALELGTLSLGIAIEEEDKSSYKTFPLQGSLGCPNCLWSLSEESLQAYSTLKDGLKINSKEVFTWKEQSSNQILRELYNKKISLPHPVLKGRSIFTRLADLSKTEQAFLRLEQLKQTTLEGMILLFDEPSRIFGNKEYGNFLKIIEELQKTSVGIVITEREDNAEMTKLLLALPKVKKFILPEKKLPIYELENLIVSSSVRARRLSDNSQTPLPMIIDLGFENDWDVSQSIFNRRPEYVCQALQIESHIARAFAATHPQYQPGDFFLRKKNGAICQNCKGSFISRCSVCEGTGIRPKLATLEWKGKTFIQVLQTSVIELYEEFLPSFSYLRVLRSLLDEKVAYSAVLQFLPRGILQKIILFRVIEKIGDEKSGAEGKGLSSPVVIKLDGFFSGMEKSEVEKILRFAELKNVNFLNL